MKRLSAIIAAILAILVAAILIVPRFIPASVYREQIEKAATTALERDVSLEGEARLSVFPSISARIGGLKIANSPDFPGENMIEAGEIRGKVKLLPLLTGRVEIGEITLKDATIRLEKEANGSSNWQFGTSSDSDSEFNGGIDSLRLTNTSIYYNDRQAKSQYALTEFSGQARLTSLDAPFTSQGAGRFNGQAFDYKIKLSSFKSLGDLQPSTIDVELNTDYGRVAYDGALTLGETPLIEGAFDVDSDTIGAVLQLVPTDLPFKPGELKSLTARGQVSGPATTPQLDFSTLKIEATGLNLDYQGTLSMDGATPGLSGAIDVSADRIDRLMTADNPQIALAAMLGKLDFAADVSGPLSTPVLSNIRFKQRSAALDTDYTGTISLADGGQFDGNLSTRSSDPRAVLGAFNVDLPAGQSMQSLSVDGNVTGNLKTVSLSNATLALDDMRATGSVGADLAGARPRVLADLDMQTLDLTPFLGAGADPADKTANLNQDWNDDPLALEGLRAVDATLDIRASKVIVNQVTLEDALLKTRLDDGRLSAIFRQDDDKPGFRAFKGNWSGDLVLDASRSTPSLSIEALADSVVAQEMLSSLTGFKNLNGIGAVHVDLTSSGNSIKSLVSGLNGNVESDVTNGILQGLNLAKMVRSAENLQGVLTGGNLTLAGFRDAISPDAETDFSSLVAGLSFTNGVASVTNLNLDNPVVQVTGSGAIDLGNRSIDIRLVPAFDKAAQGQASALQLNGVPIPVRIHGNWSAIKYELDAAYVAQVLARRATGQIGEDIADSIGGDLGNIVGGIVGGNTPRTTPPAQPAPTEETATEPAPAEPPRSIEDELKDRAVEGALGAIFGREKSGEDEEEAASNP